MLQSTRVARLGIWCLAICGMCALAGGAVLALSSPARDRATRSAGMSVVLDIGAELQAAVSRVVRPAMSRTEIIAKDGELPLLMTARTREEQTQWLNRQIVNSTEIDAIALFDASGKISAINTVYGSGQPIEPERIRRILDTNFGSRKIIQGCLVNNTSGSELEFQTHCDITPALFDSTGLSVAYSLPVVESATGKKIGVVSSRLKFDRLSDLVDRRTIAGGAAQVFFVSDTGSYYSEAINAGKQSPPVPIAEVKQIVESLGAGNSDYAVVEREGKYLSVFPLHEFHTLEGGAINVLISVDASWLLREGRQDRWIKASAVALVGVLILLVALLIASRRAAEQARREIDSARQCAEAANVAKSSFLANMSHEIRTPMTAIVGYADLLLDPSMSDSDRLNHVQTIRRNSEHLLSVVNDILDISKVESGRLKLELIECSPAQIVTEVASLMRVKASHRGIGFDVVFDGPIPQSIHSDPTRLRQILLNLVGNAIKFTERGEVRVVLRCTRNDSADSAATLTFAVHDSGVGLSEAQQRKLFQPFSQADASTTRRFGGTGLGLVICRRLAEMLGGSIDVSSTLGAGSIFALSINVPSLKGIVMLENVTEAMFSALPDRSTSEPSSLTGKILLAEDGIDNQKLISLLLRRAGAEVTVVDNGLKALEAVASAGPGGFDLIFMDMQMPELDGYGATAKLRARGYTGPIVALTAHAMSADRERCLKAGCDEFQTKPVRRDTLIAMAARFMNGVSKSAALPAAPIVSTLGDDPEMAQIVNEFVDTLPARAAHIRQLLDQQNLAELRRAVHQLKGAGGGYGFDGVTALAAVAEGSLKENRAIEQISNEVNELLSLLSRVRQASPQAVEAAK